jgi:hypothetical protein
MAVVQAVGQLSYIRPYVDDFTAEWLITNSLTLTAGAMILVYVSSCPKPACCSCRCSVCGHMWVLSHFSALHREVASTGYHQRL